MSKQGGRCVDLLHAISGADGTKNAYASGLVNRDDCCLPEREGRATDRRATREDGPETTPTRPTKTEGLHVNLRLIIAILSLACAAALVPAVAETKVKKTAASGVLAGRDDGASPPHPLARIAALGGQAAKIGSLIDGKVRWVEQSAPYTYSDDDGFLASEWPFRFPKEKTCRSSRC
jgi:hypothetical protein